MASNRQVKVTFAEAGSYETYEPHMGRRGRVVAMAALLVAVALAAYAPAFRGELIVGEDTVIAKNTVLQARLDGLAAIWLHPTLSPHYQPLAYSLLLLEYGGVARVRGFGTGFPQGYLAVNMLLHALNVLLLWTLLRKLEVRGALGAAILLAVHPVNVQTVAWINQQPLLLCGVFYLSALFVYLSYVQVNPAPPPGPGLRLPEQPWVLYALAVVLLGAALTSHAAAVSLPVVALVLIWWERGRLTRRDFLKALPLLLISAAWLGISMYTDVRRALAVNDLLDRDALTRALIAVRAVWIYLSHLIFPWRLTFVYPRWEPGWLDALAAIGLVGAIVAAAWGRKHVGRGPLTIVLLLLSVMLPMFLLRTHLDRYGFVSDHLAYFASMVLAASVVGWLAELIRSKFPRLPNWSAPAACATLALLLGVLTMTRLPDFRTSQAVWNSVLRHDPASALAHNQLGLIDLNDRDATRALEHFKAALVIDDSDPNTHLNIASVYTFQNASQDAINVYLQVLAISPDNVEAHFGLAQAYSMRDNSEQALREYAVVLRLSPDHVKAHNNVGLLHSQRGETKQAIESYERAIEISPGFMPPYINLANLQYGQGDVQAAALTLMKAVRIDPANYEAWMNAGGMVGQLAEAEQLPEPERIKLNEQAIVFFRQAVGLRPSAALAHKHLGMALMQRSKLLHDTKLQEAVFYLSRAVELEPENAEYRRILEQAKRRLAQAVSRG